MMIMMMKKKNKKKEDTCNYNYNNKKIIIPYNKYVKKINRQASRASPLTVN
jgi:hypothetical protein